MENLTTVVAVLVALSVASERLVEIVKGTIPWLNQENAKASVEGWRKSTLQFLAVVAGIATALGCGKALEGILDPTYTTMPGLIALGLLASGGSGFWNSIQGWVLKTKDMKKELAQQNKMLAEELKLKLAEKKRQQGQA